MTTPYTKTPLGNKRFVIQWDLSTPDNVTPDVGDTFEAVDCELVSIHATTIGEGALSKLNYSNKSSNAVAISMSAQGSNVFVVSSIPQVRFYTPTLEEAEATCSVALLFKEI